MHINRAHSMGYFLEIQTEEASSLKKSGFLVHVFILWVTRVETEDFLSTKPWKSMAKFYPKSLDIQPPLYGAGDGKFMCNSPVLLSGNISEAKLHI